MEAPPQPPKSKIPPLYIRDKKAWHEILPTILSQKIQFSEAKAYAIGIKVTVESTDDHRNLSTLLRAAKVPYHTYALPEEKLLRVVIRGLPRELNTEVIKTDLLSQNLPVHAVHRMYHPTTKKQYDMVLVTLDLSPQGKQIYNIRSVCYLSGLSVEPPRTKGRLGQCHKCQVYGHSARTCYARPRCVKCLEDHATIDCTRKERSDSDLPSCVLCGQKGHPANYRGCPKAPREPKRRNKPFRQPDDRQNDRQSHFTPAPPPATSAWSKPLYPTRAPAPAAKPASHPGAQTPPTHIPTGIPTPNPLDSASLSPAMLIINNIDLQELAAFNALVKVDLVGAAVKYQSLLETIKRVNKQILP